MEPISDLQYVMLTKITILQGRVRKVFFSWAGQELPKKAIDEDVALNKAFCKGKDARLTLPRRNLKIYICANVFVCSA